MNGTLQARLPPSGALVVALAVTLPLSPLVVTADNLNTYRVEGVRREMVRVVLVELSFPDS